MADHITEEEQIETLKRWWAENGTGIVTGVVLALAGYFGYQWWQTSERDKAEAASNLYQSFVEAVSANEGQPDNKQLTTAKSVARQLKDEFGKRIYASQAALRLAAIAAGNNDLEAAAKQLQWVLDNASEPSMELLAKRRLAAVKAARGEPDEALALLEGEVPPAFAALYAETRGDILLQKGDEAGAHSAYQQALAQLLPDQANSARLLRMKSESLAPAEEEAAAEDSAGPAQSGTDAQDQESSEQ
ncbi:YfgM family protein [Microbulbifer halophilus]|uniref:Ancillary SecYEG translocon subunit n=1 Tax=Microbulbifer halophilus TaxID=453963 RepID=A0ABW5E7H6_9GAMM|nr:tetratricopeptide repeat protein [Microbulbifer halophilus]MCW8125330.1 tetratricopeptide repeat protein [Microbulbifer halophilus]